MNIRIGKREDAPSIARFQVDMAMETEDKKLDVDTVTVAAQAVFDDPGKGFYVVAEIGGDVVASLLITYEWSDWRNFNMWYIQSVFVDAEHRGKGVYKAMYQFVMEMAKEDGPKFVRLYVEFDNEKAQKVYESLGMKRMPYYMYETKVE